MYFFLPSKKNYYQILLSAIRNNLVTIRFVSCLKDSEIRELQIRHFIFRFAKPLELVFLSKEYL